ncbi:hypothetical protein [Mucilaginibacter dorajii]|uniref:Uncharacterized protein n=2 Tax=Mucilaginibacter dorajii TaxID=692994 RepID=A0ABP7R8X0_9SPHI|nr:hypothetical protein [Mucilaginibacter dorajii]
MMKKHLSLLALAAIATTVSCKKEVTPKPAAPKEQVKETVKATPSVNNAAYDYQKAITAKRTLNPAN